MFHTIISEKDNIINSNILIFDFSLCTRVLTSRNYRILDKAIAFFDFQIYIFSKPCAIINHRGPRGQINNVANSQRNEAVFTLFVSFYVKLKMTIFLFSTILLQSRYKLHGSILDLLYRSFVFCDPVDGKYRTPAAPFSHSEQSKYKLLRCIIKVFAASVRE